MDICSYSSKNVKFEENNCIFALILKILMLIYPYSDS